jgi:anti-anti-sigma factor
MNIEYIDTTHDYRIAKLHGELDALGCAEIRLEIEQIADTQHTDNIALDLSQVSFLDSSGIGLIVFLFKRLKSQTRALQIIGAQGQPQELILMLRIETAIPVNTSFKLEK